MIDPELQHHFDHLAQLILEMKESLTRAIRGASKEQESDQDSRREKAVEGLRSLNWTLPPGWKWNREESELPVPVHEPGKKLSRERYRKLYHDIKPAFELIDGIPEQKPEPTLKHSALQTALIHVLGELGFEPLPDLTLAISETWELIPDMTGFLGPDPEPEEPYPTKPVAAVFEVLSDDPFLRLYAKCRKYAEWGVQDILVLDPVRRLGWHWDPARDSLIPIREKYQFHSLARELNLEETFSQIAWTDPTEDARATTDTESRYLRIEDLPSLAECSPESDPDRWGNWQLRSHNWTLVHTGRYPTGGAIHYEIDLEKINTADAMLNWIFHLCGGKTWMTAQDCADLIEAFRSIFHPQQNLLGHCSHQPIDASEFLRERYKTDADAKTEGQS
jgi:Uma2 family endonuclease